MTAKVQTCHSLNYFEIAGKVCITSADTIDGAQATEEWIESENYVQVREWV